jgi:hypothetical protein
MSEVVQFEGVSWALVEIRKDVCVMIDDEDAARVRAYSWQWANCYPMRYARSSGRKLPNGKREYIYLHRLVMNAPPGKVVDHIDGDTRNNRKENLRLIDAEENKRMQRR